MFARVQLRSLRALSSSLASRATVGPPAPFSAPFLAAVGRSVHTKASADAGAVPGDHGGAKSSTTAGLMGKLKEVMAEGKALMTNKEKLRALGFAFFAAYAIISNVTYGSCLAASWMTYVIKNGVSPLAAGQWTPFLAYYGTLWTLQSVFRPARMMAAVALAPVYDSALDWLKERLKVSKRAAFFILLAGITAASAGLLFEVLYLMGGFPEGIPQLGIPGRVMH